MLLTFGQKKIRKPARDELKKKNYILEEVIT